MLEILTRLSTLKILNCSLWITFCCWIEFLSPWSLLTAHVTSVGKFAFYVEIKVTVFHFIGSCLSRQMFSINGLARLQNMFTKLEKSLSLKIDLSMTVWIWATFVTCWPSDVKKCLFKCCFCHYSPFCLFQGWPNTFFIQKNSCFKVCL